MSLVLSHSSGLQKYQIQSHHSDLTRFGSGAGDLLNLDLTALPL